MSILSRPYTYDDLLRERETRDERLRLELIEGEIVVTPAPSLTHQVILHRLDVLLDQAIVATGLGLVVPSPFDVFLEDRSVLQPDLIVLLLDCFGFIESERVECAPSLAVEIVSPSSGRRDRVIKRDLYAKHGVPEYWLIDPEERTVTIFSDPRDGQYRSEITANDVAISATIPALSVDLAALFAAVPGH